MLLLKRRQNNFIKGEAAAESSVWKMLLPSFLGIIVCTICLAGMTWAWFTSGVQSQSTISAKEYSLNETITVQNAAKSGALEKSADGNYTLAANTVYVVKLKPSVKPRSGGYCMLKITPAGGSEAVYYTKNLEASEVCFTISNGDKEATCQLIAAWGQPEVSKTANKTLIGSGNSNTIEINGGASSDASTSEPADSNQSAPATKDNKDGSSGGNSVDGTSGQDGANSQNQTDKASGSDKAGNKTNEIQ